MEKRSLTRILSAIAWLAACGGGGTDETGDGTDASGSTGAPVTTSAGSTTAGSSTGNSTTGDSATGDSSGAPPDPTSPSGTSSVTDGDTDQPPPPPPVCGDGDPTPDEECDLGADNADDGVCTTACTVAYCGDGKVFAGVEACDDGNAEPDDGCDNACGVALELPPAPRLVSGFNHSCALSSAGALRCWGSSDAMTGYGQMGYGHLEGVGDEPGEMPPPDVMVGGKVAQVSAFEWVTCAVLVDGSVRCWGKGDAGQLGNGGVESIGDEPGEMPPPPLLLGGPAVEVAAGGDHSCARMVDGQVRCWGNNTSRQLGFDSDDAAFGDEPGEMPPPPVPLPRKAVQVIASGDVSCAVLASGTAMCWGGWDQHAPPTVVPIGGPVVALTQLGMCAHLAGGAVRCWGRNDYGELGYGHAMPVPAAWAAGDVPLGGPVRQIASGGQHTCAVLVGGALRCWGSNPDGRLGYGDDEDRGDEPGEMPTPDVAVGGPAAEVSLGGSFTCVRLESGEHRCWGWGDPGQLGLGHHLTIGDEPGEMPPAVVPVF